MIHYNHLQQTCSLANKDPLPMVISTNTYTYKLTCKTTKQTRGTNLKPKLRQLKPITSNC